MQLLEQKLCCGAAEARVKDVRSSLAWPVTNEGYRAEADKRARQPGTPFSVSHIDESLQQYNDMKVS